MQTELSCCVDHSAVAQHAAEVSWNNQCIQIQMHASEIPDMCLSAFYMTTLVRWSTFSIAWLPAGVDATGSLMALLLSPNAQPGLQQAALALLLTKPLLPSVTAASTRAVSPACHCMMLVRHPDKSIDRSIVYVCSLRLLLRAPPPPTGSPPPPCDFPVHLTRCCTRCMLNLRATCMLMLMCKHVVVVAWSQL